ncbi:MAG TPA: peptidoglycan-binding protein [Frankiaceae bacterium]|nr:peptidoglycan-binding protein [Frankiaceae bacterium]
MSIPATIHEGSTGNVVELAQYELCRDQILGGPSDVDGVFGPRTEQSVREFQRGQGLTVDGIVGPQTWNALLAGHAAPPTLGSGSTGTVVRSLQTFLNEAYPPASPPLAVDGHYGVRTEHAVEVYQAAHAVTADGIVGFKTWVIHIGAAGAMVASQVGV